LREQALAACLDGFPEVTFTVTGHCMQPQLRDGDRVVLHGPARRRPRFGDVVLTRASGTLRLHRLVWTPAGAGARWRTKADRARTLDPALPEADVLGTVVSVAGRPCAPRAGRALVSLLHAVVVRAVRAGRVARARDGAAG
jgi:hypothetical protein